jgi:hypothetical protein
MNMKRNVILYFYNLGKFNIRAKQVKKKYLVNYLIKLLNYFHINFKHYISPVWRKLAPTKGTIFGKILTP